MSVAEARPLTTDRLTALLELPGITWRHDVDRDLVAALKMAQAERDLGVEATYYLMVRSPYYNLFSPEGAEAVERIHKLGHRLGIHCYPNVARHRAIGPIAAAELATRDDLLLRAGGLHRFSRALSFHCPPDSLVWADIPGWDSAYAPRWEGHYLADSRGAFLHGDPEDREERPLQVNLHPETWWPEHPGFLQL